jgi:hypothetical protein
MNARAEAEQRLGGAYEARVLEPSPPALDGEPWFADDPVARGVVPEGRLVVSPVGTGDLRWEELVADDAGLEEWCAERWLAAYRRLPPAPRRLVETRQALHKLAEEVISPARQKANGKIGLRYTRGGFGTPFFGNDVQIRLAGDQLIVSEAGVERSERLEVDAAASAFIGDWYGFAASVLEELRAQAGERAEPSRVQLWPEHFDIAVELGAQSAGARAAYGLSPGDEQHPEPYAYVAPWVAPEPGELWQAKDFAGAELSFAELLDAPDQRAAALDFLRARLVALSD